MNRQWGMLYLAGCRVAWDEGCDASMIEGGKMRLLICGIAYDRTQVL